MKITAPAAALGQTITLAATRDKKAPSFAHLVAEDGRLSIVSCDGNVSIAATIQAKVSAPGKVAIPADRLSSLINACSGPVSLTADQKALTIEAGAGSYCLPLVKPPQTLVIAGKAEAIEISADDALRLFEPVAAAGTESSRFYLRGCFWHGDGSKLISVGTNGVSLIMTAIETGSVSWPRGVIVPSASLAVMGKLIRKARPERVVLRQSGKLIEMACPAFTFTSRLVDAQFPDYQRILPTSGQVAAVAQADLASCSSASRPSPIANRRHWFCSTGISIGSPFRLRGSPRTAPTPSPPRRPARRGSRSHCRRFAT
jgi:DNA polymerase III subunit beta